MANPRRRHGFVLILLTAATAIVMLAWDHARLAAQGATTGDGPAITAVQPWPTAQHDAQRTGRAAVAGPQRARLDREYLLGRAHSTGAPVVTRSGHVYFTATYCVKSKPIEGCIQYWTTPLRLTPAGTAGLLDSNPAHNYRGTPAIGDDGTIFLSRDDATIAFRPSGRMRWMSSGGTTSPIIGPDGSVIVVSGAAAQFELLSLDPGTGAVRRSAFIPEAPITDISIARDGSIYYGAGRMLVALRSDGSERWRYDTDFLTTAPAIGRDGTIYAAGRRIIAFNRDGSVKWSFTPPDRVGAGSRLALAADGTIRVQTLDGVTALTPAGTVKWQHLRLAGALGIVLDRGGTSYYVALEGGITALDPSGQRRWRFPFIRPFDVIFGLAIGGDGTLWSVGNRFAYALVR